MGFQQNSGGRYSRFSEINVTPFVDVMLVLLVIFMVTAPMLQQSLNLSLPETVTLPARIPKDPFILQIKKDVRIYIGSEAVPVKDLREKLKAIFEARSEKSVYVAADKSVPYRSGGESAFGNTVRGLKQYSLNHP